MNHSCAAFALLVLSIAAWADGDLDSIPLIVSSTDSHAWTAAVSLPIPREHASASQAFRLNGMPADWHPIAWWERNKIPRRVMVYQSGSAPIGASPIVSLNDPSATEERGESPWKVTKNPFRTIDYKGYRPVLRGTSHEATFASFEDVVLDYRGKSLRLRLGARWKGKHHWQQWLAMEKIHESATVSLWRVGGLLYNEDSFHFCDLYLELFGNGVGRAKAHFVNNRMVGDGYEFHGIPVIGFSGEGIESLPAILDGSQTRFDIRSASLDITQSADLISPKYPGRIYTEEGVVVYQPWLDQRVTDKAKTFGEEFVVDIGDETVPRGMARTVRFTFSLSEAPPRVAACLAPSWMYAMAGELWPGTQLPAEWRFASSAHAVADKIAKPDRRYHGTYEGGYTDAASEGKGGSALIYSALRFGDPQHRDRGLAYAYNWADIMIDHVDWSVRQPFTGYYWKTHPYTKFDDLVWAYLETGDPYLLETAEHTADAYYALMRSAWPVRSIGRGVWPVTGMLHLFRVTGDPVYLERSLELVEMAAATYAEPAQLPGHQIGVGPNGIGNFGDSGVQGFADLVLAQTVIDAAVQDSQIITPEMWTRLLTLSERVVNLVLDSLRMKGENDPGGWREYETSVLILTLLPLAKHLDRPDLALELEKWVLPAEEFLTRGQVGRPHHAVTGRPYYDAITLGATWEDGELKLAPRFLPLAANGKIAQVHTPQGPVRIRLSVSADGTTSATPLD